MKTTVTLAVLASVSLASIPALCAAKPVAKKPAAAPVGPLAAPLPPLDPDGKPHLTMEEGLQSFEAAGYRIVNGQPINLCGKPGMIQFTYKDLNGDGFPESIGVANDPCYGGPFVTIVQRQKNGVWAWLFRARGQVSWAATKTNGWLNMHLKTRCDVEWVYAETSYQANGNCPADFPDPNASAPPLPTPVDFDQAFAAADMVRKNAHWTGCPDDDYGAAEIANGDYRDLNQDGVNDLIITDAGTACYGNTGQGFKIVVKGASGKWQQFYGSPGIPTFLKTTVKTPGGWPDMEVGGPGFCFPVYRWNGKDYAFLRNHEYDKGACKRQGM